MCYSGKCRAGLAIKPISHGLGPTVWGPHQVDELNCVTCPSPVSVPHMAFYRVVTLNAKRHITIILIQKQGSLYETSKHCPYPLCSIVCFLK